MSDHLPIEVMIEILVRLPVKCLIRFRCVSKTWRSLIASPHFISTHLNRALSDDPQTPPSLLFHFYDMKYHIDRFTLHSSDDSFLCNPFASYSFPFHGFQVIGSFNGLICLADYAYNKNSGLCILWNPSIQKLISLPNTTIGRSRYIRSHAFGYDSKTDDYKLVRLFYLAPPVVEIYTLRTGTWRSVTAYDPVGVPLSLTDPPYDFHMCYVSPFLNGAVHWRATRPTSMGVAGDVIVSLNTEDETFHEMGMPNSLQGVAGLKLTVAVFDGLLALVQKDSGSVWVMKEYGVAESWTKLFDIDFDSGLDSVISLTNNGEALLVDRYGYLFYYEPGSQQSWGLNISGLASSFNLNAYVESLVLLN